MKDRECVALQAKLDAADTATQNLGAELSHVKAESARMHGDILCLIGHLDRAASSDHPDVATAAKIAAAPKQTVPEIVDTVGVAIDGHRRLCTALQVEVDELRRRNHEEIEAELAKRHSALHCELDDHRAKLAAATSESEKWQSQVAKKHQAATELSVLSQQLLEELQAATSPEKSAELHAEIEELRKALANSEAARASADSKLRKVATLAGVAAQARVSERRAQQTRLQALEQELAKVQNELAGCRNQIFDARVTCQIRASERRTASCQLRAALERAPGATSCRLPLANRTKRALALEPAVTLSAVEPESEPIRPLQRTSVNTAFSPAVTPLKDPMATTPRQPELADGKKVSNLSSPATPSTNMATPARRLFSHSPS